MFYFAWAGYLMPRYTDVGRVGVTHVFKMPYIPAVQTVAYSGHSRCKVHNTGTAACVDTSMSLLLPYLSAGTETTYQASASVVPSGTRWGQLIARS